MSHTTAARTRRMTNLDLATALGSKSAALGEALALHLKAHGTLIPHTFMGLVLTHVRAIAPAGNCPAEIAAILDSLESGMEAGDRETRSVISMSFLSEAEREPFYSVIEPHLGPRARAHFDVG